MQLLRRANPIAFIDAFRADWFTGMSGSLSVPFAALGYFVNANYAKAIWYAMAAVVTAVAAYRVWAAERRKVIELQGHILTLQGSPSPITIFFDSNNPNNTFWSLRSVLQHDPDTIHDTQLVIQYRVEITNDSDLTIYDVRCFQEEDGIRTALMFDETESLSRDMHPGQKLLVNFFQNTVSHPDVDFFAGMDEPMNINFIALAKDKAPATRHYVVDLGKEPAVLNPD